MSHAPLRHFLHLVATTLAAVTLCACANPGSGPDGGPYDETPPHIVSMTPAIGSVNIKTKKVSLLFDELIKVENPSEKVTVSPPQMEVPEIKVSGRRVNVSLSDSLKPNTTYTIDFSDAIEDSNEGNPLGNFTYYFSTGGAIDTMEIAGYVLAAENLEPQKGLLVGLHSDLNDSAFTALPFERVARTDSRGHFCIKGIAPGTYRIYALKDIDGDFKMSRGEMMAALRQDITPTCFPDVRQDTAWHDSIHYDSISIVHFTHYKPDDLVLRAFSPVRTDRQFLKSQRDEPEWFRMYFTAASTERPKITGLNFNADELLLEQANATNDTITYWLRTTDLPQVDSLRMTYTYDVYDDSLACNVWQTDTLELVPRHTMARRLKQQAEDNEKWQKQLEKRHKRGDYSQEKPPQQFLRLNTLSGSGMPLLYNPTVTFDEPITRLDTTAIHLRLRQDSVMVDAPMALVINHHLPQGSPTMGFKILGEWRYGQKYEITIDSAAVTGLYGLVNNKVTFDLSYGKEDQFGSLFVHLPGADSTATVQLLSSDTKVERQVSSTKGRADFYYIKPGKYYLRLFYDHNRNGRWDTGDYAKQLEPEEVFYFPHEIEVRANWDIEQTWRPEEMPLYKQKPQAITKQKADKEKTIKNRNAERLRNK